MVSETMRENNRQQEMQMASRILRTQRNRTALILLPKACHAGALPKSCSLWSVCGRFEDVGVISRHAANRQAV